MKKLILFIAFISLVSFADAQWQQTSLDSGMINCLAIKGDTIFAGSDNGVYLSADNGNSWSAMNTGLTNTDVLSFGISGNNIFAGTTQKIFLSSNNGTSWIPVNTGLSDTEVVGIVSRGTYIYAAFLSCYMYVSSNNGTSWTSISNGIPKGAEINSLAIKDSILLIGTIEGIYLSKNNGANWTLSSKGMPRDSITGYTGYPSVSAITVKGDTIFAGTNSGIYLSSNNGNSWDSIGLLNNVSAFSTKGDTIVAGNSGGYEGCSMLFSSNSASSWSAMNYDLPAFGNVYALAINKGYLFAGGMGWTGSIGVWKIPLSEVGIKEINNNESNIKVYPNPVTDEIRVISNQCSVNSVEIYNILGEKIYSLPLTDNRSPITINCSSFAKGVYFIKATTSEGAVVKKFIKE